MNRTYLLMFMLSGMSWTSGLSADETPPLTLSVAVERAVEAHPALRAVGLQHEIASAERDADALPPATMLGLTVENFAGGGNMSGFDGAETTLTFSRLFERGDKAELRREAGELRLQQAEIDAWATRLDVESATEILFYRVLAAQSAEKLAAEAVEQAKRTLAIVERRVEIGRSSVAEQQTALIRLARATLMREQGRRWSAAARNQLAMQWGEKSADFDAVAGDLLRIPPVPDPGQLQVHLNESPELTRLESESNLAAARQRLAAAQAKTDIELSAGVRYLSEPDDAALVVGINLPFGQGRRSMSHRRAASARLARAPLVREQRRRELEIHLSTLHAEIEQRRLALAAISDEMVPRARASLELYRNGYERGGYSLLELTEAQNLTQELGRELIDVAAELHGLRIELARLSGGNRKPGA